LAAIALGVGGKWMVHWWAGPEAVPSTSLLWAMLLYTLAYGGGMVVAQPLNGSGRINAQLLAAVITAALNIPLALVLADRFGIAGVVMSQAALMFALAIPIQLVGVFGVLRNPRAGDETGSGTPTLGGSSATSGVVLPPQQGVEALSGRQMP
jgi:O-antigen/teichoic acid export membrane protein